MLWLVVILTAGLLCVAYGIAIERRAFVLRSFRVPILPVGATRPITILHLSDLHFVRNDRAKAAFIASLPAADITVVTGDFLAEAEAVDTAVAAAREARGEIASYFVLGSNDRFIGRPMNYLRYLKAYDHGRIHHAPAAVRRAPTTALVDGLRTDGWIDLDNDVATCTVQGTTIEFGGVDDAHIHRHDLAAAVRRRPDLPAVGVTHSPDPGPDLLAMGYDLVVAGHTHGGQVRLPVVGALVNNSQLPNRYSRGLFRMGRGWFHISAGLGTSKWAPFRFLCRPEASLLTLIPAV